MPESPRIESQIRLRVSPIEKRRDQKLAQETTRREFFRRAVASFVLGSIGFPWRVAVADFSANQPRILPADERDLLKRFMFGCPTSWYQAVVGNQHPNLPGVLHPDNRWTACNALTSLLGLREKDAEASMEIRLTKGPKFGVGSPTSCPEFRWVFEQRNPLHLKVGYVAYPESQEVIRYVEGQEYASQRKGLAIGDRIRYVEAEGGWQQTDYCLITVIPNFFNLAGLQKEKLVLVGGPHGIGTRAFLQVFESPVLKTWFLKQIQAATSGFFQAWFTVREIRHDNKRSVGRLSTDPSDRGFHVLPYDRTLALAAELHKKAR